MIKIINLKNIAAVFILMSIGFCNAQILKANFGYEIDSSDNCLTVHFHDSSTGTPIEYLWSFGDNTGTTMRNPTHSYVAGAGIIVFDVQLKVIFDSSNNWDTITKQVMIRPCNICTISAFIDLDYDTSIAFSGILNNRSSGGIHQHFWNFGDGDTSALITPVHTYPNPGKYTITYIATDTIEKCSDTALATFTIDSAGFLKRQVFILTVIDRTRSDLSKFEKSKYKKLNVYPNPANGLITIDLNKNLDYTNMTILNSIGQIVYNGPVESSFDMNRFAKGIYTIEVYNKDGKQIAYIVKE